MAYSYETTILLGISSKKVRHALQKSAEDCSLKIFHYRIPEDLIAIPCFILVLDKKRIFPEKNFNFLREIAKYANINEWQLWYHGSSKSDLPAPLKRYAVLIDKNTNFTELLKLRMNRLNNAASLSGVKTRVGRIIDLFITLKGNGSIDEQDTCRKYKIHKRTLQRDIQLLRELHIGITYDGMNNNYKLF